MPVQPHLCRESKTCTCSIQALEPDEACPVHGCGPWPPRCEICGRLLPWSVRQKSAPIDISEVDRMGYLAEACAEAKMHQEH